MLLSELVFDSAGISLCPSNPSRMGPEAKSLVYDVCDELRKHQDHKDHNGCQPERLRGTWVWLIVAEDTHLGERDTFAFEERTNCNGWLTTLRKATRRSEGHRGKPRASIWLTQEDRLAEWSLATRVLELLDAASQHTQVPDAGGYHSRIRTNMAGLGPYHREMEQAVNQWDGDHDGLEALVARARSEYFRSVEGCSSRNFPIGDGEGMAGQW